MKKQNVKVQKEPIQKKKKLIQQALLEEPPEFNEIEQMQMEEC